MYFQSTRQYDQSNILYLKYKSIGSVIIRFEIDKRISTRIWSYLFTYSSLHFIFVEVLIQCDFENLVGMNLLSL